MSTIVDSHIHLSDNSFQKDFQYISNFFKITNTVLVSVSVDLETSIKNVKIATKYPKKIFPFIGIHPLLMEKTSIDQIEEFLLTEHENIAGIGEIGLDIRDGTDNAIIRKQIKLFEKQLVLAEKFRKPVSIHSRGSVKKILQIISSYNLEKVLLHWFTGDEEDIRYVGANGLYTSFGPPLVYSKNKQKQIPSLPKESLLTETDGPVRFGGCFENRTALPTFIPSILFTLSKILKKTYHQTQNLILKNSEDYLGMKLLID